MRVLSFAIVGVSQSLLGSPVWAQEETQPAPSTAPDAPADAPADEGADEPPAPAPAREEPALPPALAQPAPTSPVPPAGGAVVTTDAPGNRAQCPKEALLCWQSGVVAVWPKLRVRPGYEYVEADPQILYIGGNDGFFVDAARIGAEGNIADLVRFRLTLDGASLLPGGGANQPVSPVLAATRDAWLAFTPSPWLVVQAGQQNMPSEYEGNDIDAVIPFTRRSVLGGGVRPGHGNAIGGLSPGRQIGVVIGSGEGARVGDIPLEYRLGIANGNGQNFQGNDNKLPAAYLRLGSGFSDLVRVGIGGRLNPRTVGTLPNLYTESDAVGFIDSALTVAGLELVGEVLGRQTSLTTVFPDPANPSGQESAFGAAGWVGYTIDFGALVKVKPALRVSFYDPSTAFATDQLLETTIGVRLDGDAQTMPLSFLMDFTILTELGDLGNGIPARDIADNRLTALLQIEL